MLLNVLFVAYARCAKHHRNAKYAALLSFPFGLLDFMLDGVFLSTTITSESQLVSLLGYASLAFITLPFFLNLVFIVRIVKSELKTNDAFSVWFSKHAVPFIILVVISSTNSGAVLVTCCGVGRIPALSAPWSPKALMRLNAIGLVTNLGEDLPQILIQVFFIGVTYSHKIPSFVIVSITMSLLMVITNVIRRCLGFANDKEQLIRAETFSKSIPMLQASQQSSEVVLQ